MSNLSVVIATFTRTDMLKELLKSLAFQTVPVDVIVCDDGSNPFSITENYRGVKRYIWAARDGGYHRVLRYNEGVLFVKTPFVVMLDDDCLPVTSHWASFHLSELRESDVVRGLFLDGKETKLTPWFSSINVSMGTTLAQQMGPFDPHYDGNYGHEDLDMGNEIKARQLKIGIGSPGTAINHRGTQRMEYHTGLNTNIAYYSKKWNL